MLESLEQQLLPSGRAVVLAQGCGFAARNHVKRPSMLQDRLLNGLFEISCYACESGWCFHAMVPCWRPAHSLGLCAHVCWCALWLTSTVIGS